MTTTTVPIRCVFARIGERSATLHFPTRENVQSLQVGDLAPSCFGRLAPVTSIYAQRDDIHGRAFVCYYTTIPTPSGGLTISCSMKEDTLQRSVASSNFATSAELDRIEWQARKGIGILPD